MNCNHRKTLESTYRLTDGVLRCRKCVSEVLQKMQRLKGLPPNDDLLLYPHKLMLLPPKQTKTHCRHGHSMEDAMVRTQARSFATVGRYDPPRKVKTWRVCRTCHAKRNKLRARRKGATMKRQEEENAS